MLEQQQIKKEEILDKSERINELIDEIFSNKTIKALVVSDNDGLPIASKIYSGNDELELIVSAVMSSVINIGRDIGVRLEMGNPQDLKLNFDDGILLVRIVQGRACSGIILPMDVNLPYFEIKLMEFNRKLLKILK